MKKDRENDLKNTDHQTLPDRGFNEPEGKDHVPTRNGFGK